MPRHKKPAGTAVDPRNGARATLTATERPAGAVERFDPPADLSRAARDAWDDFWNDRPSLLLTPSARVVLLRWIDALDRYVTNLARADAVPVTQGSTGQPIISPYYKIAEQAKATMDACEKQLGIGSLNASALGLAAIQERKSLAELNARYSGAPERPAETAEDDPRLMI